jgi:hypothetical protein
VQFVSHRTLEGERDDFEVTDVLKHVVACGCVGLLLATPMKGNAGAQEAVINQVTLQGTVQSVDHVGRTVTIRGAQGNIVTLDVPMSVTRFDQVKVGDTISATYSDRVSVRLKPANEPEVDRVVQSSTTPAAGALPGGNSVRQRETTVTVTAWDPATKVVTFTSPAGVSYTRRVSDSLDPTVIAGLKVGQRVDVTRTEASSITMQFALAANPPAGAAAAPAAAQATSLEHRFTISFQYGPDNSFSGNVIKQTDGATTGGVPINFQDVGYDDVFGEINVFKVGIGYRTTPRSEGIFNFTFGKSGADLVQIGTAGSAFTVPLNVQFSDYKYWGIEGGQRFYFTRARFTPYVGYLVGANRYQEITANFVNVPSGALPGLAAQDGAFFDKSWALSLGPTVGFLVGLGPIEVMGELEIQYIGKMSDVDWLVEEGLRDINDDSSRWSYPILFGARVRF